MASSLLAQKIEERAKARELDRVHGQPRASRTGSTNLRDQCTMNGKHRQRRGRSRRRVDQATASRPATCPRARRSTRCARRATCAFTRLGHGPMRAQPGVGHQAGRDAHAVPVAHARTRCRTRRSRGARSSTSTTTGSSRPARSCRATRTTRRRAATTRSCMTSGHNRWSIHSMNITNRILLQTHRGRPHLVMNDARRAPPRHRGRARRSRCRNDLGDVHRAGEALGIGAAGTGDLVQRLGAVPVRDVERARRTSSRAW